MCLPKGLHLHVVESGESLDGLYGVCSPLFSKVDASAHGLVLPRTGQHLWILTSDRRLRTDSGGQDKGSWFADGGTYVDHPVLLLIVF